MIPSGVADLVHAPLAHWARTRGGIKALDDGHTTLTFSQLHDAVRRRAEQLARSQACATIFVSESRSSIERLVDFLAIISSGRCAAVGDAEWSQPVRDAVLSCIDTQPRSMPAAQPSSPFYVGFTSGSTGIPKGFRRDHRSWVESFRVCIEDFGADAAARVLAPGSMSHSLFLFGALLGLWSGGGTVVQDRFSAPAALETLRRGETSCLVAVPSQLILMIELAARRSIAPIDHVRLVMISGARWMRDRTAELQTLFPRARIVEFYGASETSFIAWMDADANAPAAVVGRPFSNVQIDIRSREGEEAGLIYVRSPMLFMDYVGQHAESTAALREGDWLSVQDMGYLDEQGRLCLVGRQSRMIVTQGKNLFAEELESVLMAHPQIAAASAHGVPDALRGMQVAAIVQFAPGAGSPDAAQLARWCRERLETYKAPRRFFVCDDWRLTRGGKTDHGALGRSLMQHLQGDAQENAACLRPLH